MIKKEQMPIFITNIVMLVIFFFIFVGRKNYEFLGYIGVIILFLCIILATNKKVYYPLAVLWGLTLWSFMHLSGGGLMIGGKRLYELILIPIVGDPYNIFKYDQLVHIIGFGVATILMYVLLKPYLKPKHKWVAVGIVVVMAGLGVGAVNEIIEFTTTVFVPDTKVGGYENTSLDLVADLIGGLFAMFYIKFKSKT